MKIATFISDRFRPYLPDRSQVNPNVLGFELAEWLSRALAAQCMVTSYPGNEDWGWYLEFADGDDAYLICCSGSEEGGAYAWRVFVERRRRFFRRQHPPTPMQEELFDSVLDALHAEQIAVTVDEA